MKKTERLENERRVRREIEYMDSVVAYETGKENLEKTLYWLIEEFRKSGDVNLIPAIQYVQNCLYNYHK